MSVTFFPEYLTGYPQALENLKTSEIDLPQNSIPGKIMEFEKLGNILGNSWNLKNWEISAFYACYSSLTVSKLSYN